MPSSLFKFTQINAANSQRCKKYISYRFLLQKKIEPRTLAHPVMATRIIIQCVQIPFGGIYGFFSHSPQKSAWGRQRPLDLDSDSLGLMRLPGPGNVFQAGTKCAPNLG